VIRKIPLTAAARIELQRSGSYPSVSAVLESFKAGPIPLPTWLLGQARRQTLPLYPVPGFPGRIEINSVTLQDGILKIN
jgi:hypothetical protein